MKTVDGVRDQRDTQFSPAHEQVRMMALAFRDLAESVGQREGLAEVLHFELALEVMGADQRPVGGNLSAEALHSFRGQRRNAALAGNALAPGEILPPNR